MISLKLLYKAEDQKVKLEDKYFVNYLIIDFNLNVTRCMLNLEVFFV